MEGISNSQKEIKSIDDLVLIHLTDYPPIDGIIKIPRDAGAMVPIYAEDGKTVIYDSWKRERNTIHFTVNGEVTGHDFGDWSKSKYAIIIPLKKMLGKNIVGHPADIYAWGSVVLPEGTVVLCSKDDKNKDKFGQNVSVVQVDEEYVNGKANEYIQSLGYKVEQIDKFNLHDEQDNKKVISILQKEFPNYRNSAHWGSIEANDEKELEDNNRIVSYAKLLKEDKKRITKEGKLDSELLRVRNWQGRKTEGIFAKKFGKYEDKKYKSYLDDIEGLDSATFLYDFCYKMEEAGMPISTGIIREILNMVNNITATVDERRIEPINAVEDIFMRKVAGEIKLYQIKDTILEKQSKGETVDFDTLLEHFDEEVYEYTSEERRNEFCIENGIELNDIENIIINNSELKNLYVTIDRIKDVPFGQLSTEEQDVVNGFKENFQESIGGPYVFCGSEELNDSNESYMLLMHEEGEIISDEIIAKLGKNYIGKSISYEEYGAIINFKDLSDDETLVEFFERFEKFIPQLEGIIGNQQKAEQISVQELGKQTLEEQEDTISKRKMESRLSEIIKAYVVEKGGNQK